jgi:membrane protease YdiL (CAAX protease family)
VSALLFGAFHGNLTQGIAAALLGICLGIACLCTDSLLVPVLMHAASNCAAVLVSLPALEEVMESDLLFLAIPCFSALSAGVFFGMYAGPFRRLLKDWKKDKERDQT